MERPGGYPAAAASAATDCAIFLLAYVATVAVASGVALRRGASPWVIPAVALGVPALLILTAALVAAPLAVLGGLAVVSFLTARRHS